jgi:formate/nitrite transporter FocA (FNT family)
VGGAIFVAGIYWYSYIKPQKAADRSVKA